MRLTEYRQLLSDEFGEKKGSWISHSHTITGFNATADELVDDGVDLRKIWRGLCDDFDIPEERRLGKDKKK